MIPRRWPLHPPPLPGEVLSSWLERTARLYQLTLTALVEHNLAMQDIQLGGADLSRGRDLLDIDPPARLLQVLHDRTGVPVEQLRHMSVAGWTPWLLDTLDVDQADTFDTFVRQDSLLFDHIAVARRPAPGRWRPWLPTTGYGERGRRTCPQCAERPEWGLLLMAQLPIMVSCPEHGCLMLPAGLAVRHYPGAPEPAIIATSTAVQVMDRRTHEGATTGQVTLPRRTVHVGVWFRLLRIVLDEVNTPISYLRWKSDKQTLERIWDCVERPVRAGQTRWVPYEALDWNRQVAMLEAAATAMDLVSRGIIYPAGTLGPLLREEPHRPVDGDPLNLSVWQQVMAGYNTKVDAARGDRDASRRLLHEVTRWATPATAWRIRARDHDAARRSLIKAGLRAEDLPYWPGMNVMVLPPE